MKPLKYKEIDDNSRMELVEQLVRNNLKDKDNVIMDFEVDLIKMIKKISVTQLLKNNKKHLKKFADSVMKLERNVFLPLNIKSGIKQAKRFNRLFTEKVA